MPDYRVKATIDTRRATENPDTHVLDVVVTVDYPQSDCHFTVHLSEVKLTNFRGCNPSVTLPHTVIFEGEGLHDAIIAAILDAVEKASWNLPENEVVTEARYRVKMLIRWLTENGQSLGFDESSDTLFIAPKGMLWTNDSTADGGEYVPVTSEELQYRTEKCDLCSGKICFCHANDSTEYLERCGLRKAK